jgi:hypothetical protein
MRQLAFLVALMIGAVSVWAQASKVSEPSEEALNAFKAVMDAAYEKDQAKLKSLMYRGNLPAEELDEVVKAIGEKITDGLQRPKPVASARAGKIAVVMMSYREPGDTEDTIEPTYFILEGDTWKLLFDEPEVEGIQADWDAIEAWADKKEDELDPARKAPTTQPDQAIPTSPMPR